MPKLSDRCVKCLAIAFLCVYITALVAGLAMHLLLLFVAIINAAAAFMIFGYFAWNKMRVLHSSTTGQREIIVLLLEGICIAFAVYAIIVHPPGRWLTILQYVVFTLHAILLVLFIVFMFTFKIKKLF